MSNFFMFQNRIFNKDYVACAYVQYNSFKEEYTPVCEVTSSKSPVNLDAPAEDFEECLKVLHDFYEYLK